MDLNTEITKVSRVGQTTAGRLKRLGIENVRDLLYYFPFRYDDFRRVTPINKLEPDMNVNIVGQVELMQNRRSPRKRMSITEAIIKDETESIKIIWFNQPFIAKNLRVGDKVSLVGKVEVSSNTLILKSPTYEKITAGGAVHTQGIIPNYHLTANLTQKQIRFLVKSVISLAKSIEDWLPEEIRKNINLLTQGEAIKLIHFPVSWKDVKSARQRLGFNELFLLQLESLLIKKGLKNSQAAALKFREKDIKNFVESLPFKLTDAQRAASWEIIQDLGKNTPMARLLEGDVGSGKTMVAIMAMLNTSLNKFQSALMVPTEILAAQHFASISKFLTDFDINIGLLTRSAKKVNFTPGEKDKVTGPFIAKTCDIIIGTHAMIQEKIKFANLGLAIIDEQHRFGVEQRATVTKKSGDDKTTPHLLSMTATPIPRSLALALYGDLDISIIKEMPKGRKTIITKVVPELKRDLAYDFIRKQAKEGRQVFVICPLIDISDKLGFKSVKDEYKKLNELVFPELPMAMLHGRLKAKEKEEIMRNFLENKTSILVSTSVVEVGVDVANATIMMIEGADHFGLAQLHQFRGRVGRGEHQSYCFLFTDSRSPRTIERLNAMTKYNDGFELAKIDLDFRGPGEVYGTAQKGFPELKMASLFDQELIKKAREQAELILESDPELSEHPDLKEKLGSVEDKHLE